MLLLKLLELQKSVRALNPDKEVSTYHYITGSKLLGFVRPKMDELGLILKQEVVSINNTPIEYAVKSGVKKEMFTSVVLKFTWIDTEDGEREECLFAANGMNSFDKGLGSALTYAERYFILKNLHIATDEDDVDAIIRDEAIAPGKPQPRKTMSIEKYWEAVRKTAAGETLPNGNTYRDAWKDYTSATEEEIKEFDNNVESVKLANTI